MSKFGLVNIHRIADALKVEPAELFREGDKKKMDPDPGASSGQASPG